MIRLRYFLMILVLLVGCLKEGRAQSSIPLLVSRTNLYPVNVNPTNFWSTNVQFLGTNISGYVSNNVLYITVIGDGNSGGGGGLATNVLVYNFDTEAFGVQGVTNIFLKDGVNFTNPVVRGIISSTNLSSISNILYTWSGTIGTGATNLINTYSANLTNRILAVENGLIAVSNFANSATTALTNLANNNSVNLTNALTDLRTATATISNFLNSATTALTNLNNNDSVSLTNRAAAIDAALVIVSNNLNSWTVNLTNRALAINNALVIVSNDVVNLKNLQTNIFVGIGLVGSTANNTNLTISLAQTSNYFNMTIPAGAFWPAATNSATNGSFTILSTNQNKADTYDFDDSAYEAIQSGYFTPESYDQGPVKVAIMWGSTNSATSGNTNVVWEIQMGVIRPGNVVSNMYFTLNRITNGLRTNYMWNLAISQAITPDYTPQKGDYMNIQIARVGTNTADTLVGDAKLLSVGIQHRINLIATNTVWVSSP